MPKEKSWGWLPLYIFMTHSQNQPQLTRSTHERLRNRECGAIVVVERFCQILCQLQMRGLIFSNWNFGCPVDPWDWNSHYHCHTYGKLHSFTKTLQVEMLSHINTAEVYLSSCHPGSLHIIICPVMGIGNFQNNKRIELSSNQPKVTHCNSSNIILF